jgi:hypothetical protein
MPRRLLAAVAAIWAGAAFSAPEPESFTIWGNAAEDGVAVYRIPQILETRSSELIALAEARYRPADGSRADIVIRRSHDGGKTWGSSEWIERGGPTDNHVLPVLLQDRDTGTIFFFCALRRAGGTRAPSTFSYYRRSDDDGRSWSEPVAVGPILAAADPFHRPHFYFGPGRAIQLSRGRPHFPGRLIVPVFLIRDQTVQPRSRRGYGDGVLFSDDHGRTWKAGGPVPLGSFNSSEVSIAELDDGRLILNARGAPDRMGTGGLQFAARTLSFSSDGGSTWTVPIEDNSGLPRYTETHSGLLRIPNWAGRGHSVLLFSFPAGPRRTHGTVALSTDGHRSWKVKKVIVPGSFGYSNMDLLPDGTVALIYEEASGNAIHLVRFGLDWFEQ